MERFRPYRGLWIAVAIAVSTLACGSSNSTSGQSTASNGLTASPIPVSVAIDFGQFLAANGARFDSATPTSTPVTGANADERARAAVNAGFVISHDYGLLTWPSARLDSRPAWLVRLSTSSTGTPIEYVFVDAQSGSVLWMFGSMGR